LEAQNTRNDEAEQMISLEIEQVFFFKTCIVAGARQMAQQIESLAIHTIWNLKPLGM